MGLRPPHRRGPGLENSCVHLDGGQLSGTQCRRMAAVYAIVTGHRDQPSSLGRGVESDRVGIASLELRRELVLAPPFSPSSFLSAEREHARYLARPCYSNRISTVAAGGMQSSDGAAPVPPPRRPPRALSPLQARTTTASSTTTSMLRSRALARVNRIAAATGDYVAPKLESAAVSASTKLAHWRDRDRELQQQQAQSYATTTTTTAPVAAAGGPDGGYAYQVRQPKRAAAASSSSSSARALNPSTSDWYPSSSELAQGAPPYTRSMTTSSTAPSEAPSSTSTASSSRKWTTSGLGSYLNLSSYTAFGGGGTNVDADSVAATGGTGKGKGKAAAVGTDDIDEDKVLCFPGVSLVGKTPATPPPAALLTRRIPSGLPSNLHRITTPRNLLSSSRSTHTATRTVNARSLKLRARKGSFTPSQSRLPRCRKSRRRRRRRVRL